MTFYERFIQLCNKENTKPTPLIKSLGLSPGNIKRWENGATVNSDILLLLSEHFKVSIDYLLGRTDSTTNQINNNGTNNGTQSNVIHGSSQLDSTSIQVAEMFQDMNISDKTKVLNYMLNVNKKENE